MMTIPLRFGDGLKLDVRNMSQDPVICSDVLLKARTRPFFRVACFFQVSGPTAVCLT